MFYFRQCELTVELIASRTAGKAHAGSGEARSHVRAAGTNQNDLIYCM